MIDLKEFATTTNINHRTIRAWVQKGLLKVKVIKGKYYLTTLFIKEFATNYPNRLKHAQNLDIWLNQEQLIAIANSTGNGGKKYQRLEWNGRVYHSVIDAATKTNYSVSAIIKRIKKGVIKAS